GKARRTFTARQPISSGTPQRSSLGPGTGFQGGEQPSRPGSGVAWDPAPGEGLLYHATKPPKTPQAVHDFFCGGPSRWRVVGPRRRRRGEERGQRGWFPVGIATIPRCGYSPRPFDATGGV